MTGTKPLILDHSIVGQDTLTNFTLNKDREWAACRICGAIFQSAFNDAKFSVAEHLADPLIPMLAHAETDDWRERHNKTHTQAEHDQLAQSGQTLTAEAAHKLAPFGVAPVADALISDEVAHAMGTAPRAPQDNPEHATKKVR